MDFKNPSIADLHPNISFQRAPPHKASLFCRSSPSLGRISSSESLFRHTPGSLQLVSSYTSFLARLSCETQPSFECLPPVESSFRRARPARKVSLSVEHLVFFKLYPRRQIQSPCNAIPSFYAYCRSTSLPSAWFVALYYVIGLGQTRNAR